MQERIKIFRSDPAFADWSIVSELSFTDNGFIVKATIRGPVVESKFFVQPQVFVGWAKGDDLMAAEDLAIKRAFEHMDIKIN